MFCEGEERAACRMGWTHVGCMYAVDTVASLKCSSRWGLWRRRLRYSEILWDVPGMDVRCVWRRARPRNLLPRARSTTRHAEMPMVGIWHAPKVWSRFVSLICVSRSLL